MLETLRMNRGLLGQTPRNTVQADDEPYQQLEAPVTDGAKPSTYRGGLTQASLGQHQEAWSLWSLSSGSQTEVNQDGFTEKPCQGAC